MWVNMIWICGCCLEGIFRCLRDASNDHVEYHLKSCHSDLWWRCSEGSVMYLGIFSSVTYGKLQLVTHVLITFGISMGCDSTGLRVSFIKQWQTYVSFWSKIKPQMQGVSAYLRTSVSSGVLVTPSVSSAGSALSLLLPGHQHLHQK